MNETVRIVLKTIGVGMVAGLLIAAVSWGKRSTPDTAVCPAINYTIADSHVRSYVTENELNNLLYAQHLYPVGQTIRSVSLQQIEQTVIDHPMVRRAECYLNPATRYVCASRSACRCCASRYPERTISLTGTGWRCLHVKWYGTAFWSLPGQ